jgi:V8-like Glu-specific endopeptidase
MKILLFILVLSLNSHARMIFENVERTDATDEEKATVLMHQGGCTGFWPANKTDRLLAATAKHCLAGKTPKEACDAKMEFYSNYGDTFICKKVLVEHKKNDTFIVEVEQKHKWLSYSFKKRTLLLTKVFPFFGIPLTMVGYPGDLKGKLTTTKDCHITGWYRSVLSRAYDVAVEHNCSTWGGNSGGPIFLEGTNRVVGVPGAYMAGQKTAYKKYDGSNQTFYEDIGLFIENNRKVLEAEGIEYQELSADQSAALTFKNTSVLPADEFKLFVKDAIDARTGVVTDEKLDLLIPHVFRNHEWKLMSSSAISDSLKVRLLNKYFENPANLRLRVDDMDDLREFLGCKDANVAFRHLDAYVFKFKLRCGVKVVEEKDVSFDLEDLVDGDLKRVKSDSGERLMRLEFEEGVFKLSTPLLGSLH